MEGIAVNMKTYQAYSMAEALAAVKRDLGPDAVILNTRTFKRGGMMGIGRKQLVEVTATPNELADDASERTALLPKARSAQRAYDQTPRTPRTPRRNMNATAAQPAAVESDRVKTIRLAQSLASQIGHNSVPSLRQIPTMSAAPPSLRPPVTSAGGFTIQTETEFSDRLRIAPSLALRSKSEAPSTDAEGRAQRFVLRSTVGDEEVAVYRHEDRDQRPLSVAAFVQEPKKPASGTLPAQEAESKPMRADASQGEMQEELHAIKRMVSEVLQRQQVQRTDAIPYMPKQLFDMYLNLVSQELSEELADQVVRDVRAALTEDEIDDPEMLRNAVRERLAAYIPTAQQCNWSREAAGRPRVIAMVGPTGVGKTTTLAKLAASFKLRHGLRVGLMTCDTYRIAAVDQLRAYADIIGVELKVVRSVDEMAGAIAALEDCDVVLIDTAGRSQKDVRRIEETRLMLESARPDEVHLVLSGTAGERVLLNEAEAFAPLGIDKVVLTKLDEAVNFGVLVNVMRQIGKELSFVTTGQEVPDHIEPGRPDRLAECVLTGDLVT